MSTYNPSASLRPPRPTAASTVASTTSSLSPGVESHPQLGKWYSREYGLGQPKSVKLISRRSAPENRYTSVKFRTASGTAPVGELSWSNAGALAVAGGPRVGLYGGAGRTPGTSDFLRALKPGSAAQKRQEDDDEDEVDLFGGKAKKEKKGDGRLDDVDADRNINTGGLLAACAAHRSDGKLLAVGTEGGFVKICDANSRATLRTFNSSKNAGGGDRKSIRSVAWLRDGKRVVAGGDDAVVRVWNVGGGMKDGGLGHRDGADVTLRGHGDKVTSVKIVSYRKDEAKKQSKKRSRGDAAALEDTMASDWGQLVVSGSYDHTIRVWDIESTTERGRDRCLSIMDHGDPIQALLVLPPVGSVGGGSRGKKASKLDSLPLLVSAGGTTLKVWNPLNGSCLGTFPTKHAKTITSLCLLDVRDEVEESGSDTSGRKRHILTAGLDGLLRIHSASNDDIVAGSLPFLHGMQLTDPISAVAISRDMSRLAIGTTNGIVSVHQRRRPVASAAMVLERKEPRHGTYSYFMRGAHEKSHDPDDYLLTHEKKRRLAEYDVLLRRFRYGDALDAALAKRQPQAVIAVIEELGKRRGLTIALSNRDEDSLDAILSFTTRFIDDPQYTPHLVGVAHILCDIYGSLRGQSAAVDELFARLGDRVAGECGVQKMLLRLLGQIDVVMAAAEASNTEQR